MEGTVAVKPGEMTVEVGAGEGPGLHKWKELPPPPAGLYRFDAVADSVRTFAEVGPREIARFRRDGFLAIREAFPGRQAADGIEALLDLIDRDGFDFMTFEHHATVDVKALPREAKQDYVRKGTGYVHHDARLMRFARDPGMLGLLARLMGERPVLFQNQALMKPPRAGSEKPWHQDLAYFDLDPTAPVIGAWIALDPATAENGCMHMIPGTHRHGPALHFQQRDWQICDVDVASYRDVMVPLPAGGLLLFHSLVHHGTPPNASPARRRALQLHYRPASARRITEAERLALFGSEGKNVQC